MEGCRNFGATAAVSQPSLAVVRWKAPLDPINLPLPPVLRTFRLLDYADAITFPKRQIA